MDLFINGEYWNSVDEYLEKMEAHYVDSNKQVADIEDAYFEDDEGNIKHLPDDERDGIYSTLDGRVRETLKSIGEQQEHESGMLRMLRSGL